MRFTCKIDSRCLDLGVVHSWVLMAWKLEARRKPVFSKRPMPGSRFFVEWVAPGGLFMIIFGTFDGWGRRTRKLRRWMRELRVMLDPRPVYVEFSGFCCDTGRFSWAERYDHGWQAWRAMQPENLAGSSDGETYGHVIRDKADIDYYFPPPCSHHYILDSHCGAYVCVECGDHKGLAHCYCGWDKTPGRNGATYLRAMGEVF